MQGPTASPCASPKGHCQGEIEDCPGASRSESAQVEIEPENHARLFSGVTPPTASPVSQLWTDEDLVFGRLKTMGMSNSPGPGEEASLEGTLPLSRTSSGSHYDDDRDSHLDDDESHYGDGGIAPYAALWAAADAKLSPSILAENPHHFHIESHDTPSGLSPRPRSRDPSPCPSDQSRSREQDIAPPVPARSPARALKARSMYDITPRDRCAAEAWGTDPAGPDGNPQARPMPNLRRARYPKTLTLYGAAQICTRPWEEPPTATERTTDGEPSPETTPVHHTFREGPYSAYDLDSEKPVFGYSGYPLQHPLSRLPSGLQESVKSPPLSKLRRVSRHFVRMFH